jgi:type IV pilus assembly protein PilV
MTLIEVLVSIVLVSIGMVGLLGLLATAMQSGNNAQDRNRAALLANELVSDMWLYNTTNVGAAGTPLNTAYVAWQAKVANPADGGLYATAVGAAAPNALGTQATITITWTVPNKSATAASNTDGTYNNRVVANTYSTGITLQ